MASTNHADPKRSSYSLSKLGLLALNMFTNFSLLPLQAVSVCGFFVAASGLLAGIYYLLQYTLGDIDVPGYASIIAVLVLGGIQLLALGIMGEYLGRLHLNVNRKPQYTERTVLKGRSIQTEAKPAQAGPEQVVNRPMEVNQSWTDLEEIGS